MTAVFWYPNSSNSIAPAEGTRKKVVLQLCKYFIEMCKYTRKPIFTKCGKVRPILVWLAQRFIVQMFLLKWHVKHVNLSKVHKMWQAVSLNGVTRAGNAYQ